ncbi:MAG: sulfatase-like hydrolase/transferase [Paludibacter sp.]
MNTQFIALTVAAVCLTGTSTAQKSYISKPNIIFILTDDMGYGDVGILFQNLLAKENNRSQPWALTPNLDVFAKQGVQLRDHYCAAPVSASSRGSLLTGRSQGHAGVRDNQFDKALEDNHTLATVLKAAGYSTAAFGKWGLQGKTDNIPDWPAHPLKRGFDYYFGYIRHVDGHEHYPKEGIYSKGSKEVYENYTNVADGLDKCYTGDLWTASAKQYIIEHEHGKDQKKPFFVYLAYDTPHAVLELPTQAYPAGGGLKGGLQWIGKPGHMINTASGEVDSWIHPEYANATYDDDKNPATPEVPWPNVYKRYATDTRRIDDAVADLIKLLKDLKIDNNTLVVFTSDNGPSDESYLPEKNNPSFFKSYGPFDGIKRDCWEGGVRVPVLVRWPDKIPAGKIIETPSISYDWMATFAEIAGIPSPAISDGVSLLPSLTGKEKQKEGLVYVEYFVKGLTPVYTDFSLAHQGRKRNQMQMIRLGDTIGVRYDIQSQNDNFEIYNVKKDPQESTDLSLKPEMTSVQQQMKDKVLQSRRPDKSAPRPYDNDLVAAVDVSNPVRGVKWSAFYGDFLWVPDVSAMTPTKSGITEKPTIDADSDKNHKVLYFTGYINIPADGEYTFTLNVGSKALLRIHDCLVIDEDFGYQAGNKRSGTIMLKAGMHPFRLYNNQNSNKTMLNFEWSGPGFTNQVVASNVFFYN